MPLLGGRAPSYAAAVILLIIRTSIGARALWLLLAVGSMLSLVVVPVLALTGEPAAAAGGFALLMPVLVVSMAVAKSQVMVDRDGSMVIQNGLRIHRLADDDVVAIESGAGFPLPLLRAVRVTTVDGRNLRLLATNRLVGAARRVDGLRDQLRRRVGVER
jgi:hypothetical protein